MLIIIKPSTQKKHKKNCAWLLKQCQKRQISYTLVYTTGDFTDDCKKITMLAQSQKRVVVLGGDGSLHLAVNALMGLNCTLALLPQGTGNDFARGFGCTISAWRTAIFSDFSEKIDIGQINSRYFINIAGIGFDAHVVQALQSKPALSALGYSFAGFKHLLGYQAKWLAGRLAGQPVKYHNLITVFANHHYFGGGLRIAPKAELNNGYLECYGMPARGLVGNLYSFIRLLLRNHHAMSGLNYQRLTTAYIQTPDLPIEADGELAGVSPAKVTIHPQALRFCIPKSSVTQV
ncbi:YegS/Rv2252/BmrU family lipid kinase [Pseudoalteromonas haloplanktis]|uniref:YegS/Rv2252/BmrU family lipid kinase n=2 Tax=Pseudoalteromonas TaxID=53246 RepID=A0ABU1BF90_PSEHA|nr:MULTISPECIES: YegS/Rv2252/BmrU family lipid kinase [Pseudoalteromonas]MDQ9092189.1 YegS/Rv2252/BmrU family lipid kinase [Pseudoalteromonas haloplanktis]